MIFVALYVGDLIFLGNNDEMIEEFKGTMTREFEMTDLGFLKFFLSFEVKQGETGIFISQETYAKEILKKYKMTNYNPVSILMEPGEKLSKYDEGERVDANRYRSLVGSLRYLTCTRPDLSLSVSIISRFMEEPIYSHWKVLKRAYGTSKERCHLDCSTRKQKITNWLVNLTAIGAYSLWATQHFHSFQRNNRS